MVINSDKIKRTKYDICNIQTLDFSYRCIDRIDAEDLKIFSCLKSINLSHNNITSLDSNTFAYNKNLESIDLSFNQIEFINVSVFDSLPNLKLVKLNGNPIKTDKSFLILIRFTRKWYENYNKYGYLFVNVITLTGHLNENAEESQQNRIDIFQDSEHINLRKRNINLIDKDVFQEFKNLKIIDLSSNNIKFLHQDTFRNLTNLKNLYLEWNRLEKIEQRLFGGLTNLKRILLFDNSISEIHPKAFENLTNIKYIHLYNNNLSSLNSVSLFSHLSKLEELTLNGNHINETDIELLPRIDQLIVLFLFI
jgi:Leucine-rich repeat (LRR) protein